MFSPCQAVWSISCTTLCVWNSAVVGCTGRTVVSVWGRIVPYNFAATGHWVTASCKVWVEVQASARIGQSCQCNHLHPSTWCGTHSC